MRTMKIQMTKGADYKQDEKKVIEMSHEVSSLHDARVFGLICDYHITVIMQPR